MAKRTYLINRWTFTSDIKPGLSFSDASIVRLNSDNNCLELIPGPAGYPTTPGVVTTPLFSPTSVDAWDLFEASDLRPQIDGEDVTTIGYRVTDGTSNYRWDGTAWSASAGWNTEGEISSNLASFPTTAKKIGFIIQLATTDARATPKLMELKMSWRSKTSGFMEDTLVRTLVPALRGIRYTADVVYKIPFPGGTSLNLNSVIQACNVPYNLRGVDSIYDHRADPSHDHDLLQGFNQTTNIATLTSAIPVGNTAYVRCIVEPEIVFQSTGQDFVELEKYPALVITDASSVDPMQIAVDDHVTNKATGDAIRVPAPYRSDVKFNMLAIAPGTQDLQRMIDAIVEFMANNTLLKSGALDQSYRLHMLTSFSSRTIPSSNDVAQSLGSAVLYDVVQVVKPATREKAIMRFNPRVTQAITNVHQ